MKKLFVLLALFICACGNKQKTVTVIAEDADKLIAQANQLLNDNKQDSAAIILREAVKLYPTYTPATTFLANYEHCQSKEYIQHELIIMSNQEYKQVLGHNLNKKYFFNDGLNKVFISNLYEIRNERAALTKQKAIKEKLARKKQEQNKKDRLSALALDRKAYGEKLRNTFLDSGLDIKVSVYGKYNTRMKLSFSLMNDVITRKFQTVGYVNDWESMGFKYIECSDNYDYSVYWKF